MAVAITRTDLSARELRVAAAKAEDAKPARRMLAIALVLEGVDRKTAAEICGMDRQTLRDWIHRYNAEELEGLSDRRSAGPAPRLSPGQKAELARIVREASALLSDPWCCLAAQGWRSHDDADALRHEPRCVCRSRRTLPPAVRPAGGWGGRDSLRYWAFGTRQLALPEVCRRFPEMHCFYRNAMRYLRM